eukprot:452140-Rhodomonas_salina.2
MIWLPAPTRGKARHLRDTPAIRRPHRSSSANFLKLRSLRRTWGWNSAKHTPQKGTCRTQRCHVSCLESEPPEPKGGRRLQRFRDTGGTNDVHRMDCCHQDEGSGKEQAQQITAKNGQVTVAFKHEYLAPTGQFIHVGCCSGYAL